MSDDSKELSRVEDILSGEDYMPTKPMSRIEKLLLEGGGPGGKLPEVTSDDNGKILKVKDGAWDKGEDISGDKLPQVSSQDNGKVLKVVQGEWNIDEDEGDRLPVVTSSDNGKILTVKNGAWDKADRVKDAFYYSVIISLEDEVVLPTGFGYKLAEAEPKPVYLYNDSTNRLFSPIEIGRTVSDVKVYAKWQCVYTQSNKTYVETIEYNCTSGTDPLVESSTYSKEEITDEKVKQTPTNDGVYDILLSGSTAGSAEATEGAKKSSTYPLKYSTHGGILSIGDGDTNSGGVELGWAGAPNVAVVRTNQTTGVKNWTEMGLDDISFNSNTSGASKTWDGTNTSLKAALAAAAGVGGTEAVYLALADYEELTTDEKKDPTKIYFVINEGTKVSPTLSADDGNVSASSKSGNIDYLAAPWLVFDGSDRTDDNPYEYAWQPWGQHDGEWVAYEFDQGKSFSKVHIRAATMKAHTMKYYIEGSNDGSNWTNLILGAEYVEANQPAYTGSNYVWVNTDILLDSAKGSFSHIRFRQDTSIGFPYSGDGIFVANWDIYAAAASNKPSIYYKNVLYNPDELPATTISDAGKVLKVNADGLWDKGDAPIPNINSVQVPPVIFDKGSLKKVNDVSGFPGLEKVYLSAEAYDTLSTDEKNDLSKIYYISQYKYFSNNDNTMTVRRDANSDVWIFFNGWVYDPSAETNLPAGAEVYATEVGNSYGYSDPASQTRPVQNQPCWVRFNGTKASAEFASEYQIRNGKWYPDVAGVYTSPVYGKLKIGENAGSYAYSDPFDTGETISIYYGGKQYTEYEPAKPYVELTQAEYDALPSSKESDGIMHFITDAGKIILNGNQYG